MTLAFYRAKIEYFSEYFGTVVYIISLYHLCNPRNGEIKLSLHAFEKIASAPTGLSNDIKL